MVSLKTSAESLLISLKRSISPDAKKLSFRFTVRDSGSLREVARGTQTRRIVRMDDFMKRLKADRSLR